MTASPIVQPMQMVAYPAAAGELGFTTEPSGRTTRIGRKNPELMGTSGHTAEKQP